MTREEAILWMQVLKHSEINWVGEKAEDKDIIARCEEAEQEAFDMAIKALQTDLVHCKDCKWAEKAILDEYCVECTMYHTSCMKHGYCHHGERREE